MKSSAFMKKTFGENGERLPLLIGVILIMIFVVYAFLPESVPMLIRHGITVLLILLGAVSVSEVWAYTKKQHYEYLQRREEVLFKKFEGINDMLDSLKRHATLSNKQSEQSNGSLSEATDKILQVFENRANEMKETLEGQAGAIEEKIAEKMSGNLTSLSEKVETLLSSDPVKGHDWSETVEKNFGDAFRSLEDKVANQLGLTARKLDEVIAAVAEQSSNISAQIAENGAVVQENAVSDNSSSLQEVLVKLQNIENELKDFAVRSVETGSEQEVLVKLESIENELKDFTTRATEIGSEQGVLVKLESIENELKDFTTRATETGSEQGVLVKLESIENELKEFTVRAVETGSEQEVLVKLESIENELKDFVARPVETGSDANVFEAMLSDRMEPILSNLEEERNLLQHLSALVENDGKNTSTLLSDVSRRLSADIAKGHSTQEENYQIVKQKVEELSKKLENTSTTNFALDSVSTSAFASQASELSKMMERKNRQDEEQFDLIKKQMDMIERVLVEKVMESSTSSTVESIAKMSAEVNRNIRELQNTGQGAENMFRAVSVELSGVREKLENLSVAVMDGDTMGLSAKISDELGDSFQKIMLRLDNIEEQALREKTVSGVMSQESGAILTERMDQLGNVVSGMQNEVTRLLLRVLVSQDDQSEQVQKKYDTLLTQMSGMMNDTKSQLDVLKHFVEDGHRVLSENDRKSMQTAEEQLVQSAAMKEKIEVYSSVSENYRKDMLMKLDYLQQQMQSLNLLAEVLKDVSMNSKLYNFRSDVR